MHPLNLSGLISAFFVYELDWLAARYGLRKQELERLSKLVQGPIQVRRGTALYREGEYVRSVYTVAGGAFKSITLSDDGRESVADLHFEGEFLGLEAIAGNPQTFTAEALSHSRVFALNAEQLREAMREVQGLDVEMLRLMSQAVWKSEQHRLLLHRHDASVRLAAFLMYMSEAERSNGRDPNRVDLQMSRGDLAGFLGLATETLSRLLSKFARRGWIQAKGRRISLAKLEEISRVAGSRYLAVIATALAVGVSAFS